MLKKLIIIKDKNNLDDYIKQYGDYDPETNYILQDKNSEECFAIIGATYASEAFAHVDDTTQLVISDDSYYTKKIEKQLNSKDPSLNPFYLNKSPKVLQEVSNENI